VSFSLWNLCREVWFEDTDCYRDYATWTNLQNNITSNAMVCDYKMVSLQLYLV
jgi:hypothetical protein